MKRTFTNRRYHITTGSVDTASSIVEVYPPLKMPYGLMEELDRIKEAKVDGVKKWKGVVPKIIAIAKSEAHNTHLANHLGKLEGLSEAETNIYAIILLYYLLSDTRCISDHSKVIYLMSTTETIESVEARGIVQPTLLFCHRQGRQSATCGLLLDGRVLCPVKVLEEAVPLFIASFFVFNICYTEGCINLSHVLEKIFFNTPLPQKRVLVKAASIVQQLKI